jgi:hypothetical protein
MCKPVASGSERDVSTARIGFPIWASATICIAALLLFPADTSARVLSGTHTKADIQAHCDAAGGNMTNYKGGGYGCNVLGGGTVNCKKNGKCEGSDPSRLTSKGPRRGQNSVPKSGQRPLAESSRAGPTRPLPGGTMPRFEGGGSKRH